MCKRVAHRRLHQFVNPRGVSLSLEKFEVNGTRAVYDFRGVDPTDPEEKQITFSVWTEADGVAVDGVQLTDVKVGVNVLIDALRFVRENERGRRNFLLDLQHREPLPFVLSSAAPEGTQPTPPAALRTDNAAAR